MVRAFAAAVLLLPMSAAAVSVPMPVAPAAFDAAVAETHAAIAALRKEQVRQKADDIGPRLGTLAWGLDSSSEDSRRLRNVLSWLAARARVYRPMPRRPNPDPGLRWDLQRFTMDLATHKRNLEWNLQELRLLSGQAEKDPVLVAPAKRLSSAAQRLQAETSWFAMDANFAYHDILFAGFTFEAMDIDRDSRETETRAQELQAAARRLLAKVSD